MTTNQLLMSGKKVLLWDWPTINQLPGEFVRL